jgi:ComF family protein
VLPQLARLRRTALNLLFPYRCLGCGKEGELICPSCQHKLPRINPPICPKCGRPQSSGTICPTCYNQRYEIDGMRSPFRFEAVMRQAIHQFKYRNLRAIAEPLSSLLGDYLTTNPMPGEVLIPVPLHHKRLRERGYNQSELLSRELNKLIGLPVVADCLVREQHASPQVVATSVSERQNNVANAFTCHDRRLKDKKVLLIDDIATSGATLNACASALKATGANSVWGLTLAREV